MCDFRDAKDMARALRDALKTKAIDTSHSEAVELTAKAFGYENWNILSANIEATEPPASFIARFRSRPAEPQRDHQGSSTAHSAARASMRCGS
jgi:hypothetical protein